MVVPRPLRHHYWRDNAHIAKHAIKKPAPRKKAAKGNQISLWKKDLANDFLEAEQSQT